MAKKRIIDVRKSVISLALVAPTLISTIPRSAAENVDFRVENPESSQNIMVDAQAQRDLLSVGLIVDQAELKPFDIKQFGPIFRTVGEWKPINDEFEGKYSEDGILIRTRNHHYLTVNVEAKKNEGNTHEKISTKKCVTCGRELTLSKTENCEFDKGTIKGNKIVYTCQTEGCGNTYSKPYSSGHNHSWSNTTPSNPEHVHSWENWTYLDGNTEKRICSTNSSHIETQGHVLKTSTVCEAIDDSHHAFVTYTSCDSCKDSRLATKTFGEEIDCNFVLINSVTDENGVITDTYTCLAEGCGNSYTKVRNLESEHTHSWGDWIYLDEDTEQRGCSTDNTHVETQGHYLITTTSYESTDDKHHAFVTYTSCDNCKDSRLATKTLGEEIDCNFVLTNSVTGTNGVITDTYTCLADGCGNSYTKSRNPISGHTHSWGTWTYLDEDTEQRVCVTNSSHIETQGHNLKTSTSYESTDDKHHIFVTSTSCNSCKDSRLATKTFGEEAECNFVVTNSVTDENGVITDTYACSTNGCKNTYTKVRPTELTRIDIELSIDPDSLSFDYDGEEHSPTVTGIPDGVTPKFVSDQGIDAGEHVWRIEFDVPEGYYADPVEIKYTINPAVVSCRYDFNKTTGKVEAVYDGVVPADVDQKVYIVNGDESNTAPILNQFGFYKVESKIEINPDKLGNYTFSEDLNECAIYDIRRDNTWYDIDTECRKDGDDITIEVYLSASKLPYFRYYDDDTESIEIVCIPSLSFNIYFDNKQLGFEDGAVLTNAEDWDGYVNEDFQHSYDFVTSAWYEGSMPDRVKIGELSFKQIDPEAKDIVIRLDDVFMGPGSDEYPFGYLTNASACVIHPSNSIKTITRSNDDLIADAIFQEPTDIIVEEDAATEALQKFIADGFQYPEELISYEDEYEEEDDLVYDETIGSEDQIYFEEPVIVQPEVLPELEELNAEELTSDGVLSLARKKRK